MFLGVYIYIYVCVDCFSGLHIDIYIYINTSVYIYIYTLHVQRDAPFINQQQFSDFFEWHPSARAARPNCGGPPPHSQKEMDGEIKG